jgi:hypothetical protein
VGRSILAFTCYIVLLVLTSCIGVAFESSAAIIAAVMGVLVALFGVFLCVEAVLCQLTGAGNSPSCNATYPCSNLFCGEGGFLQEVNEANIFADPKSIVDLPLKFSPNTTLGAFQQLVFQNGGNASAGTANLLLFWGSLRQAGGKSTAKHPSSPSWALPKMQDKIDNIAPDCDR